MRIIFSRLLIITMIVGLIVSLGAMASHANAEDM